MKLHGYAALLLFAMIAHGCKGRYEYVCTCHVNNQDTIYRAGSMYYDHYNEARFTCDSIQHIYHPDSCTLSKQFEAVAM